MMVGREQRMNTVLARAVFMLFQAYDDGQYAPKLRAMGKPLRLGSCFDGVRVTDKLPAVSSFGPSFKQNTSFTDLHKGISEGGARCWSTGQTHGAVTAVNRAYWTFAWQP